MASSCTRCAFAGLRPWLAVWVALIAGGLGSCDKQGDLQRDVVRINAAASIAPVIEGMSPAIEQELSLTIEVNAGGSGVLAQQVTRGDRVDLFISADTVWMDGLEQQGLIDSSSRIDLAGNRMVLIGLISSGLQPGKIEDLSDQQYQPIAVGDPAYVPAGRYAAQLFKSHGLDTQEALRLAEAPNVRAAVAFVLAGQCPVGVVYASDVRGSDEIKVLMQIDPSEHDPIRYPAAVLQDAPNHAGAQQILTWFQGEKARAEFKAAGFAELDTLDDRRNSP